MTVNKQDKPNNMKVTLDIKNQYGNYYSRTKTFNSKGHLNNYIAYIMRSFGEKVIGEHFNTKQSWKTGQDFIT